MFDMRFSITLVTFFVFAFASGDQFHANAQDAATAVAAAGSAPVAAAGPAAVAVPEKTLWRFLGVPQGVKGLKTLRGRLVNRRGNFPRLERKPPILPLTAPENLESPNPAVKAAAEIKKAEDQKAQKIKAVKYLASIGCGCYDKDGKITDALLAGTDDCTPDVRLAVIEAIEDNVNKNCCSRCGTRSCCNEKTTKRLSEMAYERDNDGCYLESSEEIRRAAARVLKKCCPGGLYTGPIEEDIPEDYLEEVPEEEELEMIPAPEGELEQPEKEVEGETAEEPEIEGESSDDAQVEGEANQDEDDSSADDNDPNSMDLEDNPFDDDLEADRSSEAEDVETPEADADDLILRRSVLSQPIEPSQPIEFSLRDLSASSSSKLTQATLVPTSAEPMRVNSRHTGYASPQRRIDHNVVQHEPVSIMHLQPPRKVHVSQAVASPQRRSRSAPPMDPQMGRPSSRAKAAYSSRHARPTIQRPVQAPKRPLELTPAASPRLRKPVPPLPTSRTPSRKPVTFDQRLAPLHGVAHVAPVTFKEITKHHTKPSNAKRSTRRLMPERIKAVGIVTMVNRKTGELFLKGSEFNSLKVGTVGDVYHLDQRGITRTAQVVIGEIGRSMCKAVVADRSMVVNVQIGDRVICPE